MSLAFGGGSSFAGNIGANIIASMVDTSVSRSAEATRAINAISKLATFVTMIVGWFNPIVSLRGDKALTNEHIESKRSYEKALRSSNLETSQMGCYAGGDGTWLILSGGPQKHTMPDGIEWWSPGDFTLRRASRTKVWTRGEFTSYSYQCYYDRPESEMPEEFVTIHRRDKLAP